jgi:hypothetical protein
MSHADAPTLNRPLIAPAEPSQRPNPPGALTAPISPLDQGLQPARNASPLLRSGPSQPSIPQAAPPVTAKPSTFSIPAGLLRRAGAPVVCGGCVRLVNETESQFDARVRFYSEAARRLSGDVSEDRLTALTMVWRNIRFLGCRYSADVERLAREIDPALMPPVPAAPRPAVLTPAIRRQTPKPDTGRKRRHSPQDHAPQFRSRHHDHHYHAAPTPRDPTPHGQSYPTRPTHLPRSPWRPRTQWQPTQNRPSESSRSRRPPPRRS